MRQSALLLAAAAAIIPAVSSAENIINGNWDTMAAHPNAVPLNSITTVNGQRNVGGIAFYTSGGFWHINSITIDGFVPYSTQMYTPTASDFTLTIKSNGSTVISTSVGTSVSSYVSNGDGSSRFAVTFSDIPQPDFFVPNTGWTGLSSMGGMYELFTSLSPSNTFPFPDFGFVDQRGFGIMGISPVFDGTVSGITWRGPSPLVVDATNLLSAPVPEPSTYGLALGGLALAVVALRRRAKRV